MASLTFLPTSERLLSAFHPARPLFCCGSHFVGPLFLHLASPAGQDTSFCGGSGLQEREMNPQGGLKHSSGHEVTPPLLPWVRAGQRASQTQGEGPGLRLGMGGGTGTYPRGMGTGQNLVAILGNNLPQNPKPVHSAQCQAPEGGATAPLMPPASSKGSRHPSQGHQLKVTPSFSYLISWCPRGPAPSWTRSHGESALARLPRDHCLRRAGTCVQRN